MAAAGEFPSSGPGISCHAAVIRPPRDDRTRRLFETTSKLGPRPPLGRAVCLEGPLRAISGHPERPALKLRLCSLGRRSARHSCYGRSDSQRRWPIMLLRLLCCALGILLFASPGLGQQPARDLFGAINDPTAGTSSPVGGYARGCIAGAVQLPADGPGWQAMRLSRDAAGGRPNSSSTSRRSLDPLLRIAGRVSSWATGGRRGEAR